jgi:heat shock protein HtpX
MPGSLTYLDLIRRNTRDSAALIVLMIALAVAVGAVIGAAAAPAFGGAMHAGRLPERYASLASQDPMSADFASLASDAAQTPARLFGLDLSVYRDTGPVLTGGLVGAGAMLVLSCIGTAWAWYGGSRAILGVMHATPVTPESDPQLWNIVDEMRLAAGLPMPRVYMIPESALNAFATGRDPEHGAVAVTTGLRERLSRDQLQGVIAHEIAHIRHLDIRFALLMAAMVGVIVLACDTLVRSVWRGGVRTTGRRSNRRGGGGAAVIVLMVVALVLSIIAPLLARLIQMAYSRQREYLADAGAAELTRNPAGLASALELLAQDREPLVDTANRGTAHMFITNPLSRARKSPDRGSLFSSHPPLADRIARLRALTR